MCGRFAQTESLEIIAERFSIDEILSGPSQGYNIAPGNSITAVLMEGNNRIMKNFKWGLVPPWAKSASTGYKMINARSETLSEKPSFRNAFKKKRCLIVATGFFEWQKQNGDKLPLFIQLKDKSIFGFAGLYESWTPPQGDTLMTCTIITTDSNDLLKDVHHRMPVIIDKNDENSWLSSITDSNRLQDLLRPYPSDLMKWHYVSKIVNSPSNNLPECLERAEY